MGAFSSLSAYIEGKNSEPSPWGYIEGETSEFFQVPELRRKLGILLSPRNMKKYAEI